MLRDASTTTAGDATHASNRASVLQADLLYDHSSDSNIDNNGLGNNHPSSGNGISASFHQRPNVTGSNNSSTGTGSFIFNGVVSEVVDSLQIGANSSGAIHLPSRQTTTRVSGIPIRTSSVGNGSAPSPASGNQHAVLADPSSETQSLERRGEDNNRQ